MSNDVNEDPRPWVDMGRGERIKSPRVKPEPTLRGGIYDSHQSLVALRVYRFAVVNTNYGGGIGWGWLRQLSNVMARDGVELPLRDDVAEPNIWLRSPDMHMPIELDLQALRCRVLEGIADGTYTLIRTADIEWHHPGCYAALAAEEEETRKAEEEAQEEAQKERRSSMPPGAM